LKGILDFLWRAEWGFGGNSARLHSSQKNKLNRAFQKTRRFFVIPPSGMRRVKDCPCPRLPRFAKHRGQATHPCAGEYSLECQLFHIGIYHHGIYNTYKGKSTLMKKAIYTQTHKYLIQQLKKARLQRGLDQNEVARLLGATQSYVSKIESGQRRIDITQLQDFMNIYRKNISYFVK